VKEIPFKILSAKVGKGWIYLDHYCAPSRYLRTVKKIQQSIATRARYVPEEHRGGKTAVGKTKVL
jgi:hypothetical protein